MSAPTPATGDGSPTPGYYPDPSIPGYVRYWNGAAWVPGTSRPAPRTGEAMPAPPRSAASSAPAPAAPAPPAPSVEETGPVFLDEEPSDEPFRPEPATAWQADTARQGGFGGDLDNRVSWGGDPRTADRPPAVDAPADPRRPAEPAQPADPTGGRLPGVRSVGPQSGPVAGEVPGGVRPVSTSPAGEPPADGTVTIRAVRPGQGTGPSGAGQSTVEEGAPARRTPGPHKPAENTVTIRAQRPGQADGTMTSRPVGGDAEAKPGPQPATAPGTSAGPRTPTTSRTSAAGPAAYQGRPAAQSQAAPQAPVQPQVPAQSQSQSQSQAPAQSQPPVTSSAGGGAASWAQQVHQLAQSPGAGDGEPVLPWKPPVNDPFLAVAQAQAAARPAGLGKRLAARLIDTVLLGALVGAVAVPVLARTRAHIDDKIEAAKLSGETVTVWLLDGTTAVHLGIVLGALLILGVLYESLPTAKWGRTLGKRLCGLTVVDIESHEPPGFGAAVRRWLLYSVLGVLVVGVLNVIWCLFDRPWRQCWHDKAAHTFVTG
ncbi:RDD family protein [Streptomyces sp. NPDC048389]|uniref:RDD family protein n=1 Tax=Streptomyces sp. NPDC048389 TaxID=3154622 RepID=UPI003451C636